MLSNYFRIALRNLSRNKVFSAINILGLSLGIATCILMLLFVQHELSYDRFNEKAGRMVRVIFRASIQGQQIKEANVMPPTAQVLKKDFPEVQEATRLSPGGYPRISYGEKTFREHTLAYADSNFFQVFTLPLVEGDIRTALLEPNTIVISEAVAHTYFGADNPMGKVLMMKDGNISFKVTGVMKPIPVNAHFHFDLFASMATLPGSREQSWMTSNFFTYLVLAPGYDYKKLERKLPGEVEKYMGPQIQTAMGMSLAQFRQKGNDVGLFLQPLKDIHLHSDLNMELEAVGDIRYVCILSAIALFMLLIACINFMNLSTAGASKRSREVGIRKVLGSLKFQLVRQFMVESLLLTLIALVLAVAIAFAALPMFNALAGKNLSLSLASNRWLLPVLLLVGLVTGLLAGSYPAFFLSSFNPVAVLKGKLQAGKNSGLLRSGLVVFQFCISIILIVGTAVVYKQLSFIQHKKLGYEKDHVLIIEESFWLGKNQDAYKNQLLQDPRVAGLSGSGYLPAGNSYSNNFMVYPDNSPDQLVKTLKYDVDYNYIPMLGMKMAEGRNFSKEFGTDSLGLILNEEAAKAFGWSAHAAGHRVTWSDNDGKKITLHVIGVVKDFHFKSLHERIAPLVMVLARNFDNIIVKIKTKDIAGLLGTMKGNWDAMKTDAPFRYSFLDDRFNKTYEAEQKMGKVLGLFSGLTIFVACMGLFGLATFTAERRIKEIGIRKVLGATVTNITTLLSRDFLKLVLIALLIAIPVSWFTMNRWLQSFEYRTTFSWWIFGLAAVLALTITIITVSFRAIRAAVANPVDSLHAE